MVRHAEVAREKYQEVTPKVRAIIEAFQAGIKFFMQEQPGASADLGTGRFTPGMSLPCRVSALRLGGFAIGNQLSNSGIRLQLPAYRGSNAMFDRRAA